MTAAADEAFMRIALGLARRGLGRTAPNPAVGAVIVKSGKVLSMGYHRMAGTDHAEVAALRKVQFGAAGCDLYTTLEPCAHHGRTGPCTEAILRAGIRRVVVGARDPNPIVRGRGLRRLAKAGVIVSRDVLKEECTELNEAFNHAILEHRPYVVLKMAQSLDGRTATRSGESRWITSSVSRRMGHELRDQLDAILVGVGTVLADDPALTTRIPRGRDPIRIVLDSRLKIPLSAKLVKTAKSGKTMVFTTERASGRKRGALEARGVEVIEVKSSPDGWVSIEPLLDELYAREVNGLLVEGGASVHGSFVDARLVNKVVAFLAPRVIGGAEARPSVGGRGPARLRDALSLDRLRVEQAGPDLVVTGYAGS